MGIHKDSLTARHEKCGLLEKKGGKCGENAADKKRNSV